jgi:hypothetical protein
LEVEQAPLRARDSAAGGFPGRMPGAPPGSSGSPRAQSGKQKSMGTDFLIPLRPETPAGAIASLPKIRVGKGST